MEKEYKEKFSVDIHGAEEIIVEEDYDAFIEIGNRGLTNPDDGEEIITEVIDDILIEGGNRGISSLDEYSIIKTIEEYDVVDGDTENIKLVNQETLYIKETPRPIKNAGANRRAKQQIDLLNIFASKNNSIKKTQKLLIYNIKAYCHSNRIKDIDFARSIKVTRQYISQIENGKKVPSLDVICSIAKEMNISVGMLLSAKYPFTYSLETATLLSAIDNKSEKKQREYFKKLLTIAKLEEEQE